MADSQADVVETGVAETSVVISASGLTKVVPTGDGPLTILDDVGFTINRGETVAVVGVSGSGKSTLLTLLAGLDLPSSGDVALCGQSLTALDEDGRAALRADLVGFVFQSFQLLPNLTALENVTLPLEVLRGVNGAAQGRQLLQRVGLQDRLTHTPAQLSGGEQQRVAIARAFVTEPELLLADEPTGNLDSATGETVIDLLFELNREQGTTLVLVTHDEQLARRCDRQIRLAAGRVVVEGSREVNA
ncbi:MAG: ATP-binding cassette domain-containing protein [Porticoccaceae bacterium]|nr:ATP-binding cassette domain-containing protein [Porticoccaceae bacterium]